MQIPVGFAQANLRFTGANIPTGAEVTLGLDVAGFAGTVVQCAQGVLQELIDSNVKRNWVNDQTLSEVEVKYGPNATGPSAKVPASLTGLKTDSPLPANVTALANKNTAFGGRAGKGRLYLPGMAEEDLDDTGKFSSGFVIALQGDLELFRTGLEAQDIGIVLLHGDGPPLSIPTPVTSFTVQALPATQRLRLRR